MGLLLFVSLLWAFSFGLIKNLGVDSALLSAARLGLALLVFLPFVRLRGLAPRAVFALVGIGAVQFGVMYLTYNESFRFLAAHEVAMLTLTTPIFVTLLADAFDRVLRARALLAAVLSVAGGAAIVVKTRPSAGTFAGLVLIQLSCLAFALGQILYRRFRQAHPDVRDRDVFGLLCAGGFLLALAATGTREFSLALTSRQGLVILYLGLIASGLGFFLWNLGATRVSAGTLAVLNNAKIPLAVAVSLVVFGESADLPRLLAGATLLAAGVWLAEKKP